MYELPLLPNNSASETFLHKSGEVQSFDWIFIIEAPANRWLGEYVISNKRIYSLLFKQEAAEATISTISRSSRRPLLRNIIIILRINYKIIICTNNNNNVVSNNYSRSLQHIILFFKITMRPRKEFLRNVQTIWARVF